MSEILEEDVFRSRLEGEDINIEDFIPTIISQLEIKKAKAESLVDALVEALAAKNRHADIVRVWGAYAECYGLGWKDACQKRLESHFAEMPEQLIMVKYAGFDNRRFKIGQCVRRLTILLGLSEGVFVFERKPRKFGVITSMSYAEEKVFIDFEDRPNHGVAFGFAAEALEILREDHILVQNHKDPEGIAAMVKSDPGELAVHILRSFGPKSAPLLEELVVPTFVEEGKWKRFWDKARKSLKNNPLVEFPSKRSEPILLLQKEKAYDDDWFAGLKKNSDMASILTSVDDLIDKGDTKELNELAQDALKDRIGFVVHGAEGSQSGTLARALLLGVGLGFTPADLRGEDFVESMYEPEQFLKIMPDPSAKDLRGLMKLLLDRDTDRALQLFMDTINEQDYVALGETISLLSKNGQEAALSDRVRKFWNTWEISNVVLYWFSNNLDKLENWKIGSRVDLVPRALKVLEEDVSGERLRIRNQLRGLFSDRDWLEAVMGAMDARQRRTMTTGVKDSSAWPTLDQNSVLGKMVKLYPEVKDIVSGRDKDDAKAVKVSSNLSSFRRVYEIEKAMKHLTTVEMPQNAEDLKTAAAHGDLRENFEYHTAKDQRNILMKRQEDYQEKLQRLKPTDFAGALTDRVGMGATVTIAFEDGRKETYHVLGEEDGEESLNILSNGSGLAQALDGKTQGEVATVPSEQGEVEVTVENISELPDDIKAWITATPED